MDHRQGALAELTPERRASAFRLRVKVFADGADLEGISRLAADPLIKGFTTNPTLMRKAGVSDYVRFAQDVLELVPERPVSFEVFSDDPHEMERQARLIASWGTTCTSRSRSPTRKARQREICSGGSASRACSSMSPE